MVPMIDLQGHATEHSDVKWKFYPHLIKVKIECKDIRHQFTIYTRVLTQ